MPLKKTGKILCHVCFRRYICPVKTHGDVKSGEQTRRNASLPVRTFQKRTTVCFEERNVNYCLSACPTAYYWLTLRVVWVHCARA